VLSGGISGKKAKGESCYAQGLKPDGHKCLLHATVGRFHLFMGRPEEQEV
jgi:hypothetical protein